MRSLLLFVACAASAALVVCSIPADDGSVTDDSNEIVEGRSYVERDLKTPIDPPTPAIIGKATADVRTEATKGTASASKKNTAGGCTLERFASTSTKKVVAEVETCKSTEIVRLVDAGGYATTTWSDLNKDGKIDRFSGEDGAFVLYADANFDGKVDQTIERVDMVNDFSMKGYDENFPKSKFVHRVRDDRNHDGKLDHEKLIAKGLLPPAPAAN